MPTWYDFRSVENVRALPDVRTLLPQSIMSQYSDSPIIKSLIQGYNRLIDPYEPILEFYNKMFFIKTAEGVGLDRWGDILQISRTITGDNLEYGITLTDEQYRSLLMYKALANISAADIDSLNTLLNTLIDTGIGGFSMPAVVIEAGVMSIRWVFLDFLDDVQLAIFNYAGRYAKGAGVGDEFYNTNVSKVFGFNGSGYQPFNQGVFSPTRPVIRKG